MIRPVQAGDRPAIAAMLEADTFVASEVAVALELVDSALEHAGDARADYRVLVATDAGAGAGADGVAVGYVCYGPTPMTDSTWDLYWLCTAAAARGRGIGGALVADMERVIAAAGGRRVRVETSVEEAYGAARSFYERHGYLEVGRIPDFYKPGDDLLTLCKQIGS